MVHIPRAQFEAIAASVRQKTSARKQRRRANADFLAAVGPKRPKQIRRLRSASRSDVEKACWEACSRAFRRWWIKVFGPMCFYCGNAPVQDAAHVISRRKRGTKYDWRNLTGACKSCNWRDANEAGYHDFCVAIFIAKFGPVVYRDLVALSRGVCQHSRADLREMTAQFQDPYFLPDLRPKPLQEVTPPCPI